MPPPGLQLLWRTYQSSFPSSLLFARSRRATSLRLCVGPDIQVSQALLRGGIEFDFSALIRLNNPKYYLERRKIENYRLIYLDNL
jgi:hypothetical protein